MGEHDIVAKWLKKSADDLASAQILLDAGQLANSCYHSQQAGEKALKGYLALFKDEIPWTHSLSVLCKLCAENDGAFLEILDDAADLTDYATTTRYPGDDSVDAEEAEECLQKAGHVFVFSNQRMSLVTQSFDEQPEQSGPTMRMM